jgi:hypothetical protein
MASSCELFPFCPASPQGHKLHSLLSSDKPHVWKEEHFSTSSSGSFSLFVKWLWLELQNPHSKCFRWYNWISLLSRKNLVIQGPAQISPTVWSVTTVSFIYIFVMSPTTVCVPCALLLNACAFISPSLLCVLNWSERIGIHKRLSKNNLHPFLFYQNWTRTRFWCSFLKGVQVIMCRGKGKTSPSSSEGLLKWSDRPAREKGMQTYLLCTGYKTQQSLEAYKLSS